MTTTSTEVRRMTFIAHDVEVSHFPIRDHDVPHFSLLPQLGLNCHFSRRKILWRC